MAIVYAIKNGMWSDVTTWNTNLVPTSTDSVFANNYTVTIDVDVDLKALSTQAGAGITAGGTFKVTLPATQDVRQGTAYAGKTGVLAVPLPEQVAYGVPVGTVFGKAVIRLPDLSEISGFQLAAAFDIINQK